MTKYFKKGLILFTAFLMMLTVGCANNSTNPKKLKGKLISQGVFPIQENIPNDHMEDLVLMNISAFSKQFTKGTTIEFINDKEMVFGVSKLEYEWTTDDIMTMKSEMFNEIHKYEYENGVFRWYAKDDTFYIDFIVEGTPYTPEGKTFDELYKSNRD